MKIKLEANLELSNALPKGAETELKKFFDNANKNLLKIGTKNVGKINEWDFSGKNLTLSVSSEKEGRAHNVLPRIKGKLQELLGKNFKMGIKEIKLIKEEIEIDLEKKALAKIEIPFAKLEVKDKKAKIIIENQHYNFIEDGCVDRLIDLVSERIEKQYYEGKAEDHEVMYVSKKRTPVWTIDPTEEMLKLGWLKQGPTKGKWFFGPQITAIFKAMERIAVEEILKPLGFQEVIESHIVPFDIWLKTGHLVGMPMEIYYVSEPLTRDVAEWQDFTDTIRITKKVPEEKLSKLIKTPTAGICYAQCPGIYYGFSGKIIADKSLPIYVFDRAANSCRYESGGRHGMERVDEFHRIEPVYIGTPKQIVDLKKRLFDRYKHVFDKILEIEWRTAWVTPFYMQQSGMVGVERDKVKGTMDFEAWLPYRGDREKSEWLEYQNLSIVGDKYTKAFNIKAQKEELWSGCSGIGLERWTAVFLAQKGLDPKNWPKGFKKYLSKLPKEIKYY